MPTGSHVEPTSEEQPNEARCAGSSGSALRRAFTQQELVDEARRWLNANYSICKQEHPDKFYELLGLLVDFVTDMVPNTNAEGSRDND